jgi:methylisocitrate lyase
MSTGMLLRKALAKERPLVLPGVFHPVAAMAARDAGFSAGYLSGSGIAAGFGLPDLGMTSMTEVAAEVRRMTAALPDFPLLVDIDTGFGSELAIERCIGEMIRSGAAGAHIEDQEGTKRCGHRPNKRIVPPDEMCARIAVANETRLDHDPDFLLMARTDAFAQEGIEGCVARCRAYAAAGADALFPEALRTLEDFRAVTEAVDVPVLANITEFGRTPLFTAAQLGDVGVRIVLFPLTLFRAAMGTVARAARQLRAEGTQAGFVDQMMTREEFYRLIDYHEYEKRADALRAK